MDKTTTNKENCGTFVQNELYSPYLSGVNGTVHTVLGNNDYIGTIVQNNELVEIKFRSDDILAVNEDFEILGIYDGIFKAKKIS